ncbi:MAG TPA: deoxyribose-phosphate aldolase [Acidimicrobiales bacterium]|jgi:deoxyribose-phosphate aldolase|nr:deoxyribose-phosphate aldolase [Acidimicrobiales bacterium]HRA34856.1 deoxyribose-phosphate aldolase [Acidimicrobiales bacterium]
MERAVLAGIIDHTLLAPTATADQVALLCQEAAELGVAAVCVSPSRLPLAAGILPATIAVCTVIGFPSGAHRSAVKAVEAARAVDDGATEIDMVIDLGLAADGRWNEVEAEIAEVRAQVPDGHLLKVIVESAALRPAGIVAACEAAERAGADYVKTSTGFHPSGGATVEAVALMAATVGGRLGIKASGGIRDAGTALALVGAGATRLGCSATRSVLAGLP